MCIPADSILLFMLYSDGRLCSLRLNLRTGNAMVDGT